MCSAECSAEWVLENGASVAFLPAQVVHLPGVVRHSVRKFCYRPEPAVAPSGVSGFAKRLAWRCAILSIPGINPASVIECRFHMIELPADVVADCCLNVAIPVHVIEDAAIAEVV